MENQNKTNNTGTSLKSLEADREKVIVRTSVIGIVTNLLLAGEYLF